MKRRKNVCSQLIYQSLKRNKARVILLILLCFTGAFLPSISPLVYRQIVDQLIPKQDFVSLYVYVAILIVIPVINSLIQNWKNIVAYRISEAVTRTLRFSLFEKISKMNYADYLRIGTKSLAYRLTRGCGQIGDVFLNQTLLAFINASFSLMLVFIPMVVLEYRLACIALLAFPIVYLLLARIKKHVSDRDRRLFQTLMKGEGVFHEAIEGLRMMRFSGGKERQKEKIGDWLQEHLEAKTASVKAHEFERVSLPELCVQILYGLIFILGAMFVMTERMTIGELVAFVAYIPRALNCIKELLMIQVTFKSVEPCFRSVNEVFEIAEETSGTRLPGKNPACISFRNVCFSYSKESRFALENLNFDIHANEAVAIVGETGGGKSTLFDLILRLFEPESGEILLDGVNIREYDMEAYRELFSVVQQSHFLWNDTLCGNVIYPNENPEKSAYDQALFSAVLTEFAERLPKRDQTRFGEGSQAVSGGERQRIALAHAFYQNRGILLLDEPTSALDAETAAKIRNVLLEYRGRKTMIVITHDLASALQYDRVLVMKHGRVAEIGRPVELLNLKGAFYGLWKSQELKNDT